MLGGLLKLAGKYPMLKSVAKDVGIQSGISAGLGLLAGGPVAAVGYGAGDFLTNLPLVYAARKLSRGTTGKITIPDPKNPKQTITREHYSPSALEQGVNLGASLGSPFVVDYVTGDRLLPAQMQQPTPTDTSQAQQLYHQGMQFQNVNPGGIQSLAPNTRYQTQGLPERVTGLPVPGVELLAEQQDYLKQQLALLEG